VIGRSRNSILLAALAVLVGVLAGCGGGGDSSSSEATQAKKPEKPKALTKADFISQGDGICAEVNSAVGSIEESETEVASTEESAQVAGLYSGMIERLTKLGTPSDTEGFAEFSEAAERLGQVEGEIERAAEEEDLVALEEAGTAAVPALEGFQTAAAVYGFEACSEAPEAPTPAPGATAGGEEEESFEEGGIEPEAEVEEVAPEEEFIPEEEEVLPEEVAPETGGAGGGVGEEEALPEEGGGVESESGGVGAG
jgi:hypothetical protein